MAARPDHRGKKIREDYAEAEQGEAGRDGPQESQEPRPLSRILELGGEAANHVALNLLRRMKLSRSSSSSRWRMKASVALSSGITRYSSAFTRRFTFPISSISRRIVVSISAAVMTSSTKFS